MNALRLRRSRPVGGVGRQGIAFDYGHLFERTGDRTCRRQASDPGADDSSLPADDGCCHASVRLFVCACGVLPTIV
jgi:hypothetical protein